MPVVPRILYSVPSYHSITPSCFFHQMVMMQEMTKKEMAGKYKIKMNTFGPRMPIRIARNKAAHIATNMVFADYLFMVDDDMVVREDLLDLLLEVDEPIVGALCFNSAGRACCFVDGPHGIEIPDPNPPRDGAFERAAVGTGAILIKTEVFRALPEPWFYYDKSKTSMDVHFCRDARKAGYKIWVSAEAKTKQLSHREETTPEWEPTPLPPEKLIFA